ncbi:hybrid sensor histidine kinase/response regulator [Geomonas oryzae]|uniref:hybrid sensor histidine kinase/response regulator n=1 Tax=Geomonas oryzae TaxID=2364273 RepID=UPI00100B84C2|nr:PAS domain S-box protein [Geomonas oryzae]
MTAAPLHQRVRSYSRLSVGSAVLLSILVCTTVYWLDLQQRHTLRAALTEVEDLREARIDLCKGFLHLTLAGQPDSPFGQAEGLALLRQSISSLDRAAMRLGADQKDAAASFNNSVSRFETILERWQKGGTARAAHEVALRVSFQQLELQANEIDTLSQKRLRGISQQLERRFGWTIFAAALFLSALCGVVYQAGRARDRLYASSRESENRFRTIFERTTSGYSLSTTEEVLLMVNDAFAQMLGYEPEELPGHPLSSFMHADDFAQFLEQRRLTVSGKQESFRFEARYLHRDGSVLWGMGSSSLLRDAGGAPLYFITSVMDMTERRKAELALRESESRLRFALEGTNDGLWDIDMVTGATYLSPRGWEILGYAPGEGELLRPVWTDMLHPDDLPRSRELLQAHMEGETEIFEMEQRLLTKSGDWKWVLTRGKVVLRNELNAALRMTGTHTDLTVQKKLEEQFLQAQKMEAIGRLAGGIAHDFNNMLLVIIGFAEMSLHELGEGRQTVSSMLNEIVKAAERSANLTQQLLAFARRQKVSPKVVDLNDQIGDTIAMLKRLIGEETELVWLPQKELWPVLMDPSQLNQLLANLCVNARDALAGSGKVVIETANISLDRTYCQEHPDFHPGDYVSLTVTDNGCGMEKETVERIFEPFFTTKGPGMGTGLGLSTVYGIVKQNQGTIHVYSEPGQGTSFAIYLQRHSGEEMPVGVEASEEPPQGKEETILVVEDEPEILRMTTDMLKLQGYRTIAASSPEEALNAAEQHPGEIDLLLTDVIMPGMNGRALADRLLAARPGLKCLYMSGYTADAISQHGVLDPDVKYIQKPFNMKALARKVREVLSEP